MPFILLYPTPPRVCSPLEHHTYTSQFYCPQAFSTSERKSKISRKKTSNSHSKIKQIHAGTTINPTICRLLSLPFSPSPSSAPPPPVSVSLTLNRCSRVRRRVRGARRSKHPPFHFSYYRRQSISIPRLILYNTSILWNCCRKDYRQRCLLLSNRRLNFSYFLRLRRHLRSSQRYRRLSP
jgi:hypothetical protein